MGKLKSVRINPESNICHNVMGPLLYMWYVRVNRKMNRVKENLIFTGDHVQLRSRSKELEKVLL